MMRRTWMATVVAVALVPGTGLAHSEGQVLDRPFEPRAQIAVNDRWGRFSVVVSPTLVEYPRASAAALAESARYCRGIGKSAPQDFTYVRRHSQHVLDAWEFGGRCR